MVTAGALDPVQPDQAEVAAAVQALPRVRGYLSRHPGGDVVRLRVADDPDTGEALEVPRGAVELLARILGHMADGQGVTVVAADAEVTTQQAAQLLNVSRPYLIGLLEAARIDYRLVGTHRRVKVASLLAYKHLDDQARAQAADELTALSQEMGLL